MNIQDVDHSKLTNVMKQYYSIKIKNLDKIVLFQLGDFYEMFFEDALKVAHALELTLTSKNAGLDQKVPMCGIPQNSREEYIKRIVDLKYSIVVVEQIETAELGSKLVERKITNIISPGTYSGENGFENNFVGALTFQQNFLLAYGDVATGELFSIQFETEEEILSEILNLGLKELLIDGSISLQLLSRLEQFDMILQETENIPMSDIQHYEYVVDDAAQEILIRYLEYTQVNEINHLKEFERIDLEKTMVLSNNTQVQLELIKGIRDNDSTLLKYFDKVNTAMGKRLLKNMILYPLLNKNEIVQRQDVVETFLKNSVLADDLKNVLKEIYDFERLVIKISKKTISPRELNHLKDSLLLFPKVRSILNEMGLQSSELNPEMFDTLEDLIEILDQTLLDEAPMVTKDGGYINDGFHPEVDEYRNLKRNSNEWLLDFEQKEIDKTGIKKLRIKYNKVFGYYIEVTNSYLDQVPDEYVRKQTMANGERFITVELKEEERKILSATDLLNRLELELLGELRESILKFIPRLQRMALFISKADVYLAFASKARTNNLIRPVFNEGHEVKILNARHPIIEERVSDFIENDIVLRDKDLQVITGPNMAGKSTYMRTFGIIAVMGQIGAFVPAESCEIKIFDGIYTRIGASDDISRGVSTFMLEMKETKEALESATKDSLLIFDELGRGTSTYDGISLAKAIIIHIIENLQSKTLFSTHYHELLELGNNPKYPTIENVHVKAVEENGELIFYHKVLTGGTEKSYGIEVASVAGLDPSIVRSARREFTSLEENRETFRTVSSGEDLTSSSVESTSVSQGETLLPEILNQKLRDLDINKLTPLEAMKILNELKDEYENIKK